MDCASPSEATDKPKKTKGMTLLEMIVLGLSVVLLLAIALMHLWPRLHDPRKAYLSYTDAGIRRDENAIRAHLSRNRLAEFEKWTETHEKSWRNQCIHFGCNRLARVSLEGIHGRQARLSASCESGPYDWGEVTMVWEDGRWKVDQEEYIGTDVW